jgi:hypothetical protein
MAQDQFARDAGVMVQRDAGVSHRAHRQLLRRQPQRVVGIEADEVASLEAWVLLGEKVAQFIEGVAEGVGVLPGSPRRP